jgi:hypothetical protein
LLGWAGLRFGASPHRLGCRFLECFVPALVPRGLMLLADGEFAR